MDLDVIIASLVSSSPIIAFGIGSLFFSWRVFSKRMKTVKGSKIFKLFASIVAVFSFLSAIGFLSNESKEAFKLSYDTIIGMIITGLISALVGGIIWSFVWYRIFRFFERILTEK